MSGKNFPLYIYQINNFEWTLCVILDAGLVLVYVALNFIFYGYFIIDI